MNPMGEGKAILAEATGPELGEELLYLFWPPAGTKGTRSTFHGLPPGPGGARVRRAQQDGMVERLRYLREMKAASQETSRTRKHAQAWSAARALIELVQR